MNVEPEPGRGSGNATPQNAGPSRRQMDSAGRYRCLAPRPSTDDTPSPGGHIRLALHEIQKSGVARLRIPALPIHQLTDTPENVDDDNVQEHDTRIAEGSRDDFGVKQPNEEQDIV
ncbi:hypothetical protein ACHAPT_000126 [Fusarium lateritium]